MSPDDERHGTRRGYYAHRRAGQDACDRCKRAAAKAEQVRQLRLLRGQHGEIDATGTRRRLQALCALGFNWKLLGEHIGSDEVMIKRWAERDSPGAYVWADTAHRVAVAFERLIDTRPPESTPGERNAASRARNRALRNGWALPEMWADIDDPECTPGVPRIDYDPVVVQRILDGDYRIDATAAERTEVVARWTGSLAELARRTGWKVERYRKECVA